MVNTYSEMKHTVSELSNTNKASHILVEYLETSAILFWLTWIAKSTWPVEDFGERIEVDCSGG